MIDQVHAEHAGIVDKLSYRHQGDAVLLETSTGKCIVLSADAYVLTNDGLMTMVSELTPNTFIHPRKKMGYITKMEMVGDRQMLYCKLHTRLTVNGFCCALWLREVHNEQ